MFILLVALCPLFLLLLYLLSSSSWAFLAWRSRRWQMYSLPAVIPSDLPSFCTLPSPYPSLYLSCKPTLAAPPVTFFLSTSLPRQLSVLAPPSLSSSILPLPSISLFYYCLQHVMWDILTLDLVQYTSFLLANTHTCRETNILKGSLFIASYPSVFLLLCIVDYISFTVALILD